MLTRISIPAAAAVTLEQAKNHLRVDQSIEDSTIQIYLDAATSSVETVSGRALAQAEYRVTADCWPRSSDRDYVPYIDLPIAPIVTVVSVKYRDEDGAQQTLDTGAWTFRARPEGGRIYFTDTFEAPTLWGRPADIEVDLLAGYDAPDYSEGEDPELKMPPEARAAILLLTGHLYANRESVVAGKSLAELPQGVQYLIDKFRVYR